MRRRPYVVGFRVSGLGFRVECINLGDIPARVKPKLMPLGADIKG